VDKLSVNFYINSLLLRNWKLCEHSQNNRHWILCQSTLIQSTFPQIICHNSATILSLWSPSCHFQLRVCHCSCFYCQWCTSGPSQPPGFNQPDFYATREISRLESPLWHLRISGQCISRLQSLKRNTVVLKTKTGEDKNIVHSENTDEWHVLDIYIND
jgi:hypothetical protein